MAGRTLGRFQTDPRRLAVIDEARSWIGTPYRHQACVKAVGVDCTMLIRAVGEAVGVLAIDPDVWRRYAGYGRAPNPKRMGEALRRFMVRIAPSKARPGDVVWLEWRADMPMHLAMLARFKGRATLIHALSGAGKVVEHGYAAEWPARSHSFWRYPGLVKS